MRLYGEVRYVTERSGAGVWLVKCDPHVRIKLKRFFARTDVYSSVIKLSATGEVSHDLEWFLERFPMKMRDEDRGRLTARANKHKEQLAFVGTIMLGAHTAQDFQLALPARPYQALAADLALRTGRLLLADDVGLGKTASAIAALSDASTRPAVVVTLTHLPKQWKAEIDRFLPGMNVYIPKTGNPNEIADKRGLSLFSPDIYVINYHKLAGWAWWLADRTKSVIFDEIQELRTGTGQKYDGAKHLAHGKRLRMGLSATPIYNYGGEYFNVLNVIAPGVLGDRSEFKREWCDSGESVKEPRAFGMYMREQGLMLRRTRADVGRELPELTNAPLPIEADIAQIDKIEGEAAELARIILAKGGVTNFEKLKASEELSWKLRQATGLAKAPYVAAFTQVILEAGEKVVLYAWHREVYGIFMERLKAFNPVMFTGSESTVQKEKAKQAFISGESKVLLMSLRAGAGLDGLQGSCSIVVFAELDWSPGVHTQATGRVHRDGQKEQVTAYFLVADCGSDPAMADVLGLKVAQAEGTLNPEAKDDGEVEVKNARKLAAEFLKQRGLS